MTNNNQNTTILDLSKGIGFGLLYHPVIGKIPSNQYPLMTRFRVSRSKKYS